MGKDFENLFKKPLSQNSSNLVDIVVKGIMVPEQLGPQ
jgi:hypothetical protein